MIVRKGRLNWSGHVERKDSIESEIADAMSELSNTIQLLTRPTSQVNQRRGKTRVVIVMCVWSNTVENFPLTLKAYKHGH